MIDNAVSLFQNLFSEPINKFVEVVIKSKLRTVPLNLSKNMVRWLLIDAIHWLDLFIKQCPGILAGNFHLFGEKPSLADCYICVVLMALLYHKNEELLFMKPSVKNLYMNNYIKLPQMREHQDQLLLNMKAAKMLTQPEYDHLMDIFKQEADKTREES